MAYIILCVYGPIPHIVEPKYPGLVERYVNLGDCYDAKGLQEVREQLLHGMDGYKACYQRAYRCLRAAWEVGEDLRCALLDEESLHRFAQRAKLLAERELNPRPDSAPGAVRQRFLGAVTHKGVLCLYESALAQCRRIIHLSDRYGLSHELLTHLLSAALQNGYDAVACPDPMAPDRLAHLILPELSLAFLSSSPSAGSYEGEAAGKIRVESLADAEVLRRLRNRLRFSQRVSGALVEEAVSSLQQAKAMHDDLEAVYNPYVDFGRVQETADGIARELFP